MIYLYLNKNQVKLLYLKKTLLKQEEVSTSEKTFETSLFENNKEISVDLLASAVKEVLTLSFGKNISDNQVTLILPQEMFFYFRTEVPSDIAPTALSSFVKDKASSVLPVIPEELISDYFIKENQDQKVVTFFGLKRDVFENLQQAFSLIDLKIFAIIPETLTYFKLFEKTLRPEKKENILYVNFEKNLFEGYLYDNFGLLTEKKLTGEIDEKIDDQEKADILKNEIKKFTEDKIKINRLVISGPQSENIRQDTFTKFVSIWTNPLKRIVPNFYENYLKVLVVGKDKPFSLLNFASCFGAFIFSQEEKFSLFRNQNYQFKKQTFSTKKIGLPKKEVFIFISSFLLSFALFYFISSFKSFSLPSLSKKQTQPTVSPTVAPPSPTPTPSFKKEELKIQVLNGSGVPGKASEMKEILKKKGYQEIITGNAKNYDYKLTELQVKKSKFQASEMIKEDLKDYLTSFKETVLDEKETPDVIIIFGSDFK
jgi:hypothetical protein